MKDMDIIQQFEQATQHLVNFSPLLWSYYTDLKKQGFTDEQAFKLTADVQSNLFNRGE